MRLVERRRLRLRGEEGWTLTELLITIVLMLVVLGATLTALDTFTTNASVNTKQNDAQDKARAGIEQLARQLRNLAVPTGNAFSIDAAGRYELIFKTADPARRRVRYCLNTSAPANERLIRQLQSTGATATAIAISDHDTCPDNSSLWASATGTLVAQNVVNRELDASLVAKDRPLFSYACTVPCLPVGTAPADLSQVTEVRIELFIDINSEDKRPDENRISTGIYLRNQNQRPVASWTSRSGVGANTFVFNGSDSVDAEGRTLTFFWFTGETEAQRNAVAASTQAAQDACAAVVTCIGTGVTLNYTSPTARPITLLVRDAGGLTGFTTLNCDPTTGVCSPP